MKIRSYYNSQDPVHDRLMGGYFFPYPNKAIELGVGTWYTVTTYSIAANDVNDMIYVVRNEARVLSYTKGGNLVAIDGDFRFRDMDLVIHSGDEAFTQGHVVASVQAVANMRGNYGSYEITSSLESTQSDNKLAPRQFPSEKVVDLFTQGADKSGAKMEKRLGSFGRPVRVTAEPSDLGMSKFRCVVLPASPTLDGWGKVNGKLLDAGIIRIKMPDWLPEQKAQTIWWWDQQVVFNCRVIGDIEFVDINGNVLNIQGHLKFQVCRDNSMPDDVAFMTSEDNIKSELHPVEGGCGWAVAIFDPQGVKEAYNDRQTIVGHPFLLDAKQAREVTKDEGKKAFTKLVSGQMFKSPEELFNAEFDKKFSWVGEAFNRLLRWRTSQWNLYGMSYLDSPWMFQQLGWQWTQTLNWDSEYWNKTLKVKIRCAVRAQVVSASAANLHSGVNMSPANGTPEWCAKLHVLVVSDEDWVNIIIPSHGGCDLDDFFVIRWVTFNGNKYILITRNPNARGEYSLWNYKEGDWFPNHTTSKGEEISFPEITRKRWPKQILQALADGDTEYLKLPTEVSPDATLDDDRLAVLNEQQNIVDRILAAGKGVDPLLAKRTGIDDLPLNYEAIFTRSKSIMAEEIVKYRKMVLDYSMELPIPTYLEELGNNEMLAQAVTALKRSRSGQYYADQRQYDTDQEKKEALKKAQEDALLPPFAATTDPVVHARFALALWYASRTTPTSKGKITDQPIFGTDVFHYLLDGLLYLGIAKKPGYALVNYEGNNEWTAKCKVCGKEFRLRDIQSLVRYHNANRTCKDCRNK